MNVNGILYVWSRNTVFFLMRLSASERKVAISREPTVVSLIQNVSMIPPFSFRPTLL